MLNKKERFNETVAMLATTNGSLTCPNKPDYTTCYKGCPYCNGASIVRACKTCLGCGLLRGLICGTCKGCGLTPDAREPIPTTGKAGERKHPQQIVSPRSKQKYHA